MLNFFYINNETVKNRKMKHRPFFNNCKILSLLFFLTAFIPSNISHADEVAVIRIKYRGAEELAPIVQSLLSPDGHLSIDTRINSLVIVDNPAAIRRVQGYLKRFDVPIERLRIRVRFYEKQTDDQRSAVVDGSVSGKNWRITTGRQNKDGVEVNLEDRKRAQNSVSEYFVMTSSGSPAYIAAGKEIPYRQTWGYRIGQHRRRSGPVTYKKIETGFDVTPRIVGDQVNLKITPRVTHDTTTDGVIRFHGAQTHLMVPLGQWVEIGGSGGQQNEIVSEILSRRRGDEMISLTMALMVEKISPDER
jgi:type II secretory pathway component GspD/PulD (secretin)